MKKPAPDFTQSAMVYREQVADTGIGVGASATHVDVFIPGPVDVLLSFTATQAASFGQALLNGAAAQAQAEAMETAAAERGAVPLPEQVM